MCNKEQLVGYLYDDLSAPDRAAFEAHVAGCADCQQELGDLRRTRQQLTSWAPREPEFNFRVVRGAVEPPRRRLAFVPQWGLAAAASLLVAAGAAAIANVEIRRTADGFVVRTGWARPSATATTAAAQPVGPTAAQIAASEQLKTEVEILSRRLQGIEQAQAQQLARTAVALKPGVTATELRQILAETESRQRQEMAIQLKQVWTDITAVRANDLARVQQTLGQAQNLTNYQLRQQRSSIDEYLRTVSQQK
jgi:hypothetical protein